jgi:hypothetical protein
LVSATKKISVTATTGMASIQLGMGATTLHHWCGVMDCRYTNEKLRELLTNDDNAGAAKQRIPSSQVFFHRCDWDVIKTGV